MSKETDKQVKILTKLAEEAEELEKLPFIDQVVVDATPIDNKQVWLLINLKEEDE